MERQFSGCAAGAPLFQLWPDGASGARLPKLPRGCTETKWPTTTIAGKLAEAGPARQESVPPASISKPSILCPSVSLCSVFPSLGVVVELFGRFVTALVDTGAGVSLISLRLLRSFDVDISTLQQDSVRPLLTGVTGQSLSTCGVVSLKFRIGSFCTNHAFIVVDGVTHDLILGSDVLTASGCTLDLSRRPCDACWYYHCWSICQSACVCC